MPDIRLAAPRAADLEALLVFELDNRAFFELHINARPPSYYSADGVAAAIEQAVQDAKDDRGYQYLVWEGGQLVGRVNLTRVRRAHFHSAELGYRVAQAAGGRGHASEAVRQVLNKAFSEHGLVRVEAVARAENEGSTRVLTRNGFTPFGRSTRSVELGGTWYDLVHYERRADG
jgi:[ribosomal protein S5]-alanine N-acetyltransferase